MKYENYHTIKLDRYKIFFEPIFNYNIRIIGVVDDITNKEISTRYLDVVYPDVNELLDDVQLNLVNRKVAEKKVKREYASLPTKKNYAIQLIRN